ncbi:MAG: AAA family ATPase [Candidatus Thorarchaeota archaeon]|nr:AAA family ATPase [Candidatus Thorarchaeota archaeon]
MKIIRIEIQNFKPFKDLVLPEDGELPEGLILIRGPNSTGKSSIFEAILWAIWGSSAVTLTNEDLVNSTSTFCRVQVVFEIAGVRYKIDRSYDHADKTKVVLYRYSDKGWQRIADKTRTVESQINEILHLELDQALNTLLVRQGEVARIAVAPPSELRELLINVYNIEILQDTEKQLEHLESDLVSRVKALEADFTRPEILQTQKDEAITRTEGLKQEKKDKAKELGRLKKQLAGLPDLKLVDKIDAAIRELERVADRLKRARSEKQNDLKTAGLPVDDAELIDERHRVLVKQVDSLEKEIAAAEDEVDRLNTEAGAIKGINRDLEQKIKLLSTVSDGSGDSLRCPTCSKPLTIDERDQILSGYRGTIEDGKKQVKDYETKSRELREEIKTKRKRITSLRSAIEALERAKSRDGQIEPIRETHDHLKDEIRDLYKQLGVEDISDLLKKHSVASASEFKRLSATYKTKIESIEERLERITEDMKEQQQKVEELERKIVAMTQLRAEMDSLNDLHAHAQYIRRNLIKGFVADWVFQKRLVGIIQTATDRYITEFTNGQYTQIDLVPTKARGRSGSGLALKIKDIRDNLIKSKEQLSFGDRTAVSLALRLGISRTMSSIRPLKDSPAISPRVRSVLLDEPLAGLDKERRASVVRNLTNDRGFDQIFLITHTDVSEWDDVSVIDVEKSGKASTATLRRASD